MADSTIDGYDITSAKWDQRPSSILFPAFYSTGSPDVKMTSAMNAAFPGALHIDQANGQDDTADYVDCEQGCYTPGQVPERISAMRVAYFAKRRHNQRWPGVYMSRNNPGFSTTDVANALVAAKLDNVPFIIADWNNDHTQAAAEVANASGPYPVRGRQYQNVGPYDLDVFSKTWVNNTAGSPVPTYPFNQAKWRWCHKCGSLFYGPDQSTSHCAAGGTHDGSASSNYSLTAVGP